MGGQGPMTGNFGHFFVYAPAGKIETRDYGVARYGMEVMRLSDVLDKHLEGKTYLVGEEYTIADMMCFCWYYQLKNYKHVSTINAEDYLGMQRYTNCNAWAERIAARPAVQRGLLVCSGGVGKPWLVPATKEA
jgi:GSH-dependent disulfide-bond oxidoreductase